MLRVLVRALVLAGRRPLITVSSHGGDEAVVSSSYKGTNPIVGPLPHDLMTSFIPSSLPKAPLPHTGGEGFHTHIWTTNNQKGDVRVSHTVKTQRGK